MCVCAACAPLRTCIGLGMNGGAIRGRLGRPPPRSVRRLPAMNHAVVWFVWSWTRGFLDCRRGSNRPSPCF